jgi:ABC-type sugar transport system permease subunit
MMMNPKPGVVPRAIVFAFVTLVVALGAAVVVSLAAMALGGSVSGHLVRLRNDSILLDSLQNTATLFALSSTIQFFIVAIVTVFVRRLPSGVLPLLVVPYAAGLVAPAFSFYVFLSSALGPVQRNIMGTPVGATVVVVLIDSWQWTGILLLISLFTLRSVSPSHMEQARLESIPRLKRWRLITWPTLQYVFLLYFIVRGLDWLRKVDVVKAICGASGPGNSCETVGFYISDLYFRQPPDPSYAAYLLLLQLVAMGVGVWLLLKLNGIRQLAGKH